MAQSTSDVSIRPVTSKSRGICKYYTTERGCFSGDGCKFLHGAPNPKEGRRENEQPLLTPYDQTKRCKFFDQGFCKRGENCWFLHKSDKSRAVQDEEDDEYCSICFEKPAVYGLLGGCSHIFCLTCIKQWRDPHNKPDGVAESGNTKKCPMCRMSSKFITPSSKFWRHGTEEKQNATEAYMGSMAKIQCRYFQKSLLKNKSNPICPYGKDCFYSHLKEDGTPYVFKDGVDVCMKRYRKKARRGISLDFTPIEELLQNAFNYTMNRMSATGSDQPMSDTQDISASDTPSIHRQHNSDRGGDEEGFSPAQRWRIQDAMMRSLNNTNSAGILAMELLRVGWEISGGLDGRSERDGVEQDSTRREGQGSDDERENVVMERLGLMADEMLAEVNALREGTPAVRSHTHAPSDFSRVVFERPGYDSEGDMPALIGLSSDSEEDESDEADTDTDEREQASETLETDSGEQSEELAVDSRSSAGTSHIGIRTSDEESDEMPELVPIDPSETWSVRQLDTMQPVTSMNGSSKASGNSRPSDAFTTDGRGRVINVGDSTTPDSASDVQEQPESSAGESSATNQAERRLGGGFFGWIGSLI